MAFKEFYEWWKIDHILIKSEFVIGNSICGGIGGTIDNLSYNTKIHDNKLTNNINNTNTNNIDLIINNISNNDTKNDNIYNNDNIIYIK